MKVLAIAAALAAFGVAPAFAQTAAAPVAAPATKAACETAKMKWDEKGGKDAKGACMAMAPAAAPMAAPAKPAEPMKK